MVVRDDLYEAFECYGRWIAHKHLIEIQAINESNGITKSFQQQTFWHEVAHAILDNVGQAPASDDEKFVDLLGQCFHQVLKTKKGTHE